MYLKCKNISIVSIFKIDFLKNKILSEKVSFYTFISFRFPASRIAYEVRIKFI